MAYKKLELKASEPKIQSNKTLYDTYLYVEWAQKISRNLDEYNFLLSIKDDYDRTLIVTNANLFFEIQNLLKINTPHINEISFDEVLKYVYKNRIYYDIWYDGFYFHYSASEILPSENDLKNFIRLHFDPNAKKLTGSSMDKILSWIKDGFALDSIVESLKHYYDHRKMYQDSHVLIEHLNCEDFLRLSNSTNFKIFKYSYMIFMKLNETLRKEITSDNELYKLFLKLVQEYMRYKDNQFNMRLFEIGVSKISAYKNRTSELLIYLTNSIQGFDFDGEVSTIKKAVLKNKNLQIIKEDENYFIYKIADFETLKIYSSPHWCINRSIEQFEKYISINDDFYVILQRYPRSNFDYKSGVTVRKSPLKIKHSFNYGDVSNINVTERYIDHFKTENSLTSFFKKLWNKVSKKKHDYDDDDFDDDPIIGMTDAASAEDEHIILPRFN